jgi:hypothetical protein
MLRSFRTSNGTHPHSDEQKIGYLTQTFWHQQLDLVESVKSSLERYTAHSR